MGAMNRIQQKLVEDHLYLIRPIILNNIRPNESVQGLGYDDLYQQACEALCLAALKYRSDRGANFATFASAVVRNSLYAHCRRTNRLQRSLEYLDEPMDGDEGKTYAQLLADERQPATDSGDPFILSILTEAETRYGGSTKKGIRALQLKCLGHSNTEIASGCGVKPNLVAAWISKASGKLRNDRRFLYQLRA